MKRYTVTITRQFGSLGRPIARKMSEILNLEYYDRDIVEETSQKMGLPVSVISDAEESVKNSFFNMAFPLGSATTDQQNAIFREQARIIRDLAEKKSCIIVGRCSDYILKDSKNVVHIYIYAPVEERLKNCVDYLNMDVETARKMIKRVDKAREGYHRNYAGFFPQDCRYKQVEIDSSLLGIEGTARALSEIVKQKFNIVE